MKRALTKLAIFLASMALCLFAAELLARAFLESPERIHIAWSPESSASPRTEEPTNLELAKEPTGLYVDTPTGRRLRPNAVARVKDHRLSHRDVEIRTNALGYRNREIGPKDRRRVLFLGDSITFGDYVAEEETFVRIVEQLSALSPEPLETINAGVGAVGLANELAILVETGLSLDPDDVVVDFYLNDLQPSPGVRAVRIPAWLNRSALAQHAGAALAPMLHRAERVGGKLDGDLLARWAEEARIAFPPGPGDLLSDPGAFNQFIQERFDQWGHLWSEGAWKELRPIFEEFRRLAEVNGFALRVVVFPIREQVEARFECDHPQRKLAELCSDLDADLLDLLPILRRREESAGELFYDRCHPTPEGNRIIAEAIYAWLAG
jgi:lysophospholipase L1-like esterase